jgi:hypothetical protein
MQNMAIVILQAQAAADTEYFLRIVGRAKGADQQRVVLTGVLRAYRWQYIVSGVRHPRFARLLSGMITPAQLARVQQALEPIVLAVDAD